MSSELGAGQRYQNLLTRSLDLQGIPLAAVDDLLKPVVLLEDDPFQWWRLKDKLPWQVHIDDAAVAGQNSHVGIQNQSTTWLIVIERFRVLGGASSGNVIWSKGQLTTVDQAVAMDMRDPRANLGTIPLSIGRAVRVTQAATLTKQMGRGNVDVPDMVVPGPWLVPFPISGDASRAFFWVTPVNANAPISVTFTGYAVQALQSELAWER